MSELIRLDALNAFVHESFPSLITRLRSENRTSPVMVELQGDIALPLPHFTEVLNQFSQLEALPVSLRMITYLKNTGDRGAYFAEGILWDTWKTRILLLKKMIPLKFELKIHVVITLFSVPSLKRLVSDIDELKRTHAIDISLIWNHGLCPDFLDPSILGKAYGHYFADALFFLRSAELNSQSFVENLERLTRGDLPVDVNARRKECARYITMKDSEQSTDFSGLYPELREFYLSILTAAEKDFQSVDWPRAIEKINRHRITPGEERLCFAPFKNLSLNTKGNVGACFATWNYDANQSWPNKSLRDLWFGDYLSSVRYGVDKKCLEKHCGHCLTELRNDNFTSPLLQGYNEYPVNENGYPAIIDIEVSNKCNLQCIMCDGDHSSMIRKHEGKPPMLSPYDDEFLEQLREFIPHLKEMRFQGGEPLLDSYYYRIWELALELNPSIRLVITTNGTVYNSRFENILNKMSVFLTVSIDAFESTVYEKIRVNAKFDETLANLKKYILKSRERKFPLRVVVTPMTENWDQIPEIFKFCNENEIGFWIHNMTNPPKLSLRYLPADELRKIASVLETRKPKKPLKMDDTLKMNFDVYENFITNQVSKWI